MNDHGSIYGTAINNALGVPAPAPASSKPAQSWLHPTPAPAIRKPQVQQDTGRLHSEVYRSFRIVVREHGVSSIGELPLGEVAYWCVYFTDEEIILDKPGGDMDARVQACRNAIDRMHASEPAWVKPWWHRFDHLKAVMQ